MSRPMVFFKVDWMDYYDGREDDEPSGNHSYVKEHGSAHEDLNFLRQGSYCYGYVPLIPGSPPTRAFGSTCILVQSLMLNMSIT